MSRNDAQDEQDVRLLRRRVLALEDLVARHEYWHKIRVPKKLTAELEKTGMLARDVFIRHGLQAPSE